MKTLAELKAEQAKERAKLKAEHALASAAPVPPLRVQLTSGGLGHWLSYEVATLWDALDIMAKYQPVPFYGYKKTFTRFVPAALNVGRDAGDEIGGPYVAKIEVSQGEGFGPSAYFAFFAIVGDKICMVRISLGHADYGPARCGSYGAHFQARPGGSGEILEGRRYISGDWRANNTLSGMTDKVTKWGTGCARSVNFGYAIMADCENPDGTAALIDARLRLENLAEAMHGPRPAAEVGQ